MDRIKQAAIIMLGMGERYAAEILKGMNPKEVEAIIEAINKLGNITEVDVVEALNGFFKDANNSSGIDIVSKEMLKNSLESVVESKKVENISNGMNTDKVKWIDVFKLQSSDVVNSIVQDEHPQVLAVIATMVLSSEKASRLIRTMSKELKSQVVARMASIGPVSTFGMDSFSVFFEHELRSKEKYSEISVDGVEAVANIISYLDADSEKDIIDGITSISKDLSEVIQEKIMPFDRLAKLDKRSLQTLLAEVDNEDLVLALKGTESYVRSVFFKNMSSKSADILKDELDSKGPVKIRAVIEAQKRIISLAKKMASEDRIIISTKIDSDIIF